MSAPSSMPLLTDESTQANVSQHKPNLASKAAHPASAQTGTPSVTKKTIEIAVKGKWFRVPALEVQGKDIIVQGKSIRTASIEAEEWLETEVEDPELCLRTLKEESSPEFRADVFTFAQKLPVTQQKYDYPVEWESIAAIPLTSFKDWWEKLPQESRKNTRRAQKRGVVVEVKELNAALIQDIMVLNNDSPIRQGKTFTHYGKTLEQVTKDQQAFLDRCDYICAYADGELIGLTKLIYRGDVASILTFLSKASQSDKRPANALMAKVVERCEQKGISHLIFGMYNYGNKRHTPLREFKIRNGFTEILAPRYYVPLTFKGALSVKLKFHRGPLGLLPHSVISVLVNARARWNAFKLSRCSSMPERPNSDRQTGRSNPPAGSNL
jgi:hypothetical protein